MRLRLQVLDDKSNRPKVSVDVDCTRALKVLERIISDSTTMEVKR